VGKEFAIIHHLDPLGHSNGQSRETSVEDVRIVCANCHYILHRQDQPLDVDKLKRQISRKWTTWSSKGVKAR
jgi:5-methylcytosine-specific restriction protein A